MRGFVAAGMPRSTPDSMGSYEEWDALVRQCVIWLGKQGLAPVTDPKVSTAKTRDADPERMKLAAFLELAQTTMEQAGKERWRTAQLIAKAQTARADDEGEMAFLEVLTEIAGNNNNSINPRILGRWIEKNADRICDGRQLVKVGTMGGTILWRIREA
jgi:hypothetical protein